jgi:uncharacterized protein YbbK (DUF523 family)
MILSFLKDQNMRLCSACLLGIRCRFDGKSNFNPKIKKLASKEILIPICPEQLGGLPSPRPPCEIRNQKVLTKDGKDLTNLFKKGAKEVLKIAKLLKIKKAILKQRSPSCGYGQIYDGTFSNKVIKNFGILAKLLIDNGIEVQTEEDF